METGELGVMNSFNNTTLPLTFNQTLSPYTLDSRPVSGLTYTFFGLTCLFTVLGVCGNLLTLVIMWKSRNTRKGHDVLITALAVSDCMALIATALSHPSVHEVFGMDIRAVTTVGCKLFMGIWQSATSSSFAIVVLICIERFVAVWFPLRSMYLLSQKRIMRSVLGGVTFNVLLMFTMNILYCEIKDGFCDLNLEGGIYSTVLKRVPDTTVYKTILAFHMTSTMLILCILTPMTIVKLHQQMAIRRRLTSQEQNSGHFRTSVKLIAVVIEQITLVLLPGVFLFAIGLTGATVANHVTDNGDIGFRMITIALLINHSTNFLFYNIFDVEFRKKVLNLFGCAQDIQPATAPDCQVRNKTTAI